MSVVEFEIEKGCLSYRQVNHPDYERGINIIKLTEDALKYENFPTNLKLKWKVYAQDEPRVDNVSDYHIFNICDTIEYNDMVYPCFMFDNWPNCGIPDYEELIKNIEYKGINTPYEYNKIVFRGAPSIPKTYFCNLTYKYDWVDGYDTHDLKLGKAYCYCKNRFDLSDHTKWKYLIDIGGGKYGDGYSARLKALMFSNRVLFVQDRPYGDMTFNKLKDGENCIFIKRDFSDLEEKYKWIEQQGDNFQKEMANNLLNVARNNCRRIHAHERIRKLIYNLIEK